MDNTPEIETVQSPKRRHEEDDEVKRVPKKPKVKKSQSLGLRQASPSLSPSLSPSASLSPPPKSRSNAKTRLKTKAILEDNTTPEENTSPKTKGSSKAKKTSDITTRTSTRTRKKAQNHTDIRSSSEISTPTRTPEPEPEPESIPRGPPKRRNPAHLTMIPLELFHKILTEMTRSKSNKRINLRRPNTFNHYFHPLKSTCWKLRKEVDQYIGVKSSTWEDWDLFIDEPRNHDRSESIFHHKDARYIMMLLQGKGNYDPDIKKPILVHNKKIGAFNPESTWFRFRWDNEFISEAYMDQVFSDIIDPNNLLDNIQNLTLEFPMSRLKEELYASGDVSVSQDREMPVLFQERRPPRNFPELGHFADLKNLNIIIRHDENLSSLCMDHYIRHKQRIRVFDVRFDIARRLLGCLYESLVRRKSDRFMPMPLEHIKITGTNEVHIGPEDNRWSVEIPYIRVFEKFEEGSLPAGYNILRLVNHMYKDPDENYHLISMDLCENLR